MEEKADDGRRREAAIASAASLQSDFKPKAGVTSAQLYKFQELHKRRLQLKTRPKPTKKPKRLIDETGKSTDKDICAKDCTDVRSCSRNEDSSSSLPQDVPCTQKENGGKGPAPKERKKLHWGLDTKERWEMKANM